ncbi:MAG: NAD(+)/NADH kinase [Candidatus Omnitrophica bacterium]|nr:NAD(+)/NADH kinase [Candidatus Omnitrophota bacterium]MCB9722184.1 NAD(+)/NADH kinase [Candidatus Omnitrophota bacterium]
MKSRKILLLYKKTVYSRYKNQHVLNSSVDPRLLKEQLRRLQSAHDEHTATLKYVKEVLRHRGLSFGEYYRGGKIPFADYDIIISVGGDGTFLKAAAGTTRQLLIGVNSAPSTSVGRLCIARQETFASIVDRLLDKDIQEVCWQRLALTVCGQPACEVMNDVLFAHENPAVISRYLLAVGGKIEEQRSSGVWAATAIGSTGAIGSAGGAALEPESSEIQYLPRELYSVFGRVYQFRGGVLGSRQKLVLHSLMPKGKLFVDGGNQTLALTYGQSCEITRSRNPIRTLKP